MKLAVTILLSFLVAIEVSSIVHHVQAIRNYEKLCF